MIAKRNRRLRVVDNLLVTGIVLFCMVSVVTMVAAQPATVRIGSTGAINGSSVTEPILVANVTNLGAGTIKVSYNTSVVQVTDVANGTGNAMTVIAWNPNNGTNPGSVRISSYNATGRSGEVIFAAVTYKAVGVIGATSALNITVELLSNTTYSDIAYTVQNGSFRVKDTIAPVVVNFNASPTTILQDTSARRPRKPGTNVSRINVTVTDNDVGVTSVTINLSSIGGSPTTPMTRIEGTNMSGVWSVTTNATAGINLTNNLQVNATDADGNSNLSVSIPLTVLRRGDVKRDNAVNIADLLYIARYTVGLEPEASSPPTTFIADIVGEGGAPAGDDRVDMKDALYIARWMVPLEAEP
jgi:hypothetical protein